MENQTMKQAGFTLIELIVVIVILGILAATALPKFMNVTDQAHASAVDGTGGALGSAVSMARAQHVANGGTTAGDIANFGDGTVGADATGWPQGGTGATAAAAASDCVDIWNGVMQNPPGVADAAGAGVDYVATFATPTCTYTYQGDTTKTIAYDTTNGSVTINQP